MELRDSLVPSVVAALRTCRDGPGTSSLLVSTLPAKKSITVPIMQARCTWNKCQKLAQDMHVERMPHSRVPCMIADYAGFGKKLQ